MNLAGSDAIKSIGGVFKEYESKSLQEESWCKGLFYLCLNKKVAFPTGNYSDRLLSFAGIDFIFEYL